MSRKLRVTVSFEIDDDWYTGEGLSKKQREKKYEEEFSDIEVLSNHIPSIGYEVSVRETT